MRTLHFRLVNVFTQGDDRFSGNPLCVFEDGTGLDTQTMQTLALQFNLSETTFILPSTRASAGVRIFTPKFEMQFAGHPTLGTAHISRSLGRGGDSLTLDMPAGIIPVKAAGRTWTLEARARGHREVEESRSHLADMLGLSAADIGERPLWVNAGREQMIVPLTNEAAVRKAFVRADLLTKLQSTDGEGMAYIFAPTTGGHVLSRFFFAQGVSAIEDPATGSAAANFGGWWLAMGKPLPMRVEVSQGEYTGRPSLLHMEVDAERRIFVSGEVIELGRGTVEL